MSFQLESIGPNNEEFLTGHLWLSSLIPRTEVNLVAFHIFSSDFDIAYQISEPCGFLQPAECRRIDIVWNRFNRSGKPVTED